MEFPLDGVYGGQGIGWNSGVSESWDGFIVIFEDSWTRGAVHEIGIEVSSLEGGLIGIGAGTDSQVIGSYVWSFDILCPVQVSILS